MHEDGSSTVCPGCGLCLPAAGGVPSGRCNASSECLRAYSDLLCYTVAKQDKDFIHQHAVDTYAAQHTGGTTRNITAVFGLIGLYLALEKGYTGTQEQQAHMRIARIRKEWPRLEPPACRAALNVMDVLDAPGGPVRDAMIRQWMAAIWDTWGNSREWIRQVTDTLLEQPGKNLTAQK